MTVNSAKAMAPARIGRRRIGELLFAPKTFGCRSHFKGGGNLSLSTTATQPRPGKSGRWRPTSGQTAQALPFWKTLNVPNVPISWLAFRLLAPLKIETEYPRKRFPNRGLGTREKIACTCPQDSDNEWRIIPALFFSVHASHACQSAFLRRQFRRSPSSHRKRIR